MAAAMPTMYVTHGGGPMPLLGHVSQAGLTKFLKGAAKLLPSKPTAIVSVTAHWETRVPTVTTSPFPPMLYDYYGFPPESYEVKYPAPGSVQLASRIQKMLGDAGMKSSGDASRGFDHGTFVPLKLMFPEADIPVVQLSVLSSMDPAEHVKMGRALAPLRQEGVLILGSGSSFHNMRVFMNGMSGMRQPGDAVQQATAFDDWLKSTCTGLTGEARDKALEQWDKAPGGRFSHPREEHLIPLMVIAGAAGDAAGKVAQNDNVMGVPVSSFMFA